MKKKVLNYWLLYFEDFVGYYELIEGYLVGL